MLGLANSWPFVLSWQDRNPLFRHINVGSTGMSGATNHTIAPAKPQGAGVNHPRCLPSPPSPPPHHPTRYLRFL